MAKFCKRNDLSPPEGKLNMKKILSLQYQFDSFIHSSCISLIKIKFYEWRKIIVRCMMCGSISSSSLPTSRVSWVLQFITRMNCTNAKRQILILNSTKTGALDHFFKFSLLWKFTNTLDQVLIRFPLLCQYLTHWWNHLEGI